MQMQEKKIIFNFTKNIIHNEINSVNVKTKLYLCLKLMTTP